MYTAVYILLYVRSDAPLCFDEVTQKTSILTSGKAKPGDREPDKKGGKSEQRAGPKHAPRPLPPYMRERSE